ncbi:MAG: hypothetical protein ACRD2A_02220 [Vicinamibacterales bacterium]
MRIKSGDESGVVVFSKGEPRLDPLRNDARFKELMRQIVGVTKQ